MPEESKKPTPPYVSFQTFKNRVQGVAHEGQVPDPVDTSLFRTDSGSTQNQLIAALQYFELIDAQGHPNNDLALLATGDANKWQETLSRLVSRCYSQPQLEALAKGSPASLRKAFEDNGVKTAASVMDKVIRFFVAAAQAGGFPVSQPIAAASGRGSSGAGRRVKKVRNRNRVDTEPVTPSKGTISFPIHIPGMVAGAIMVPKQLRPEHLPMVKAIVAAVEAYANAQDAVGSEGSDDEGL